MTKTLVKAPSSNHIRTFTGTWINPIDPDPDCILPEDIAHALANQCRFTGHVMTFYSVAEHTCRAVDLIEDAYDDYQLMWDTLFHDASEAYISDLARPVKRNPAISSFYDEAENNLMNVIAEKFGNRWPIPEEVKWADDVLLRSEQRDLMLGATSEGDFIEETIVPWTPEIAENTWLKEYDALRDKLGMTNSYR